MALIDNQLYFAPGVLMKELDFTDAEAVLSAFECRVNGLFLAPIQILEGSSVSQEGALFGAALLVAALIESVARVQTGSTEQGTLIKQWLEHHLEEFKETVDIGGNVKSLADVFEFRFRNGLAHNGYVASLGRLSREIDMPVTTLGDCVIVNPFCLAALVSKSFESYVARLRSGERDIRRFTHLVQEQFRAEVEKAKAEASV